MSVERGTQQENLDTLYQMWGSIALRPDPYIGYREGDIFGYPRLSYEGSTSEVSRSKAILSEAIKHPEQIGNVIEVFSAYITHENLKNPSIIRFIEKFLSEEDHLSTLIDTVMQWKEVNEHAPDLRGSVINMVMTLYQRHGVPSPFRPDDPLVVKPGDKYCKDIIKQLDSRRSVFTNEPTTVFSAYNRLMAWYGGDEEKEHIADILFGHLDYPVFPMSDTQVYDLMYNYFREIAKIAGIKYRVERYREMDFKRYFEADPLTQKILSEIAESIPSADRDELLNRIAASGYIHKDELGSLPDNFGDRLVKNLKQIRILELDSPGICERLCTRNGIYLFFRYPDEVLIRQDRDWGNTKKPKGIVLCAIEDYSSAMHELDSHYAFKNSTIEAFRSLSNQLDQNNFGMSIYEVGKQSEIIPFATKEARQAKDEKLSFMIFLGHGDHRRFIVGGAGGERYMDDYTLRRPESNFREFADRHLTPHAPIIFVSCYVGRELRPAIESSLGRNGRNVIAHTESIGIRGFQVTPTEDGEVVIDPDYVV